MRNISRFFNSLFLLLLLNLLVKPMWILGIDRKVQLLTGTVVYGTYFAAFNFVFIFTIFSDLGITEYIRRTIAYKRGIDAHTLSRLMWLKLLLSVFMAILVFALGIFAGIQDRRVLAALILLQLFLSWIGASRAVLSGLQLFYVDAWLSVLDKLLLVVTGISAFYFFALPSLSIHTFLFAQIITAGFTLLLSVWFLLRNLPASLPTSTPVQYGAVLYQVLPFALLFFVMSMHLRADGFLLALLSNDAAAAGNYASMYRFLDATHVAATLVGGYLVAFWSRHLTNTSLLHSSLNMIFSFMMAVAFAFIAFLCFHAEALYQFFYHETNSQASALLQWGLLAIIPYFIIAIFGSMLTANDALKTFIYFVLFAALINLSLNMFFIPAYGAIASAWIANASQSLLAILLMVLVRRKYQLSITMKSWMCIGIFTGIAFITASILQFTKWHLMWQVFLFFTFCFIIMLLLRLFPTIRQFNLNREK